MWIIEDQRDLFDFAALRRPLASVTMAQLALCRHGDLSGRQGFQGFFFLLLVFC